VPKQGCLANSSQPKIRIGIDMKHVLGHIPRLARGATFRAMRVDTSAREHDR
jgi:hypothetical protein